MSAITHSFKTSTQVASPRGLETKVKRLLGGLFKTNGFVNLPQALKRDLKLALHEGVTNALKHGKSTAVHPVKIYLEASPKQIEITITDSGPGFSLTAALRKKRDSLEMGGRGLFILKNLMDEVKYRRHRASGTAKPKRENRLHLIKKLGRPKKIDAALELFRLLEIGVQELKSLKDLYEDFLDFIVGFFNVERASLLIFDTKSKLLRLATSRGIPKQVGARLKIKPGRGIAGYVYQTARPLLVDPLGVLPQNDLKLRKKGYTTKSFLSVPVIAFPNHLEEKILGVLNLTDKRDGHSFTKQELKLANLMATQAASFFHTRKMIDRIRIQEGLRRELAIVREIQNRLLPEQLPKVQGLNLGGQCYLSKTGGGDYYDVLKSGNKLHGVMADVSGHHVGSALTMASFRSLYRTLVKNNGTPGALLKKLRVAMQEELSKVQHFISCWVFEYEMGSLKISGAGHPPVLRYRAKTRSWDEYSANHLLLGLEDDASAQNKKITLQPGDLVLFYTDGLFDPHMKKTGLQRERILAFIEKKKTLGPQSIVNHLFEYIEPHHQSLRSPDDVAILILKSLV